MGSCGGEKQHTGSRMAETAQQPSVSQSQLVSQSQWGSGLASCAPGVSSHRTLGLLGGCLRRAWGALRQRLLSSGDRLVGKRRLSRERSRRAWSHVLTRFLRMLGGDRFDMSHTHIAPLLLLDSRTRAPLPRAAQLVRVLALRPLWLGRL